MAQRPIFLPQMTGSSLWKEVPIIFGWHPGFSKSQAQKSIQSLHQAAAARNIAPILDISSKSPQELGIRLSAFNLLLKSNVRKALSVETAYQGSKVFERGGPYTDLYEISSREAKTDDRVRNSGNLTAFNFMDEEWPLEPKTAFYDWLYIRALVDNPDLSEPLLGYSGFSDIAFNPERSLNCQARAAALFVSLTQRNLLDEALASRDDFIKILLHSEVTSRTPNKPQPSQATQEKLL